MDVLVGGAGNDTFVQYYRTVWVWISGDRRWEAQYVAQEYVADFTWWQDAQSAIYI
jgi:hypothetical protein